MSSVSDLVARHVEALRSRPDDRDALAHASVAHAADLLSEARLHETSAQRKQAAKIARMMDDPAGKALTLTLADQVFRPRSHARSAEQFRHLIDGYGVPAYLGCGERFLMGAGAAASSLLPGVVMPMVTDRLRSESASVILPSERNKLHPHLARRRAAGLSLNVNLLGEAILGEEEAAHRLEGVLGLLADPAITYLSVKISAIFSQLNVVAFEATVEALKPRLRKLYRAALASTPPKFVNLDMEEFRDLALTTAAFTRTLEEPEFQKLPAGIVLQAYLPDSHPVLQELTAWAQKRVASGGAPIKVRLVKGANLAMERVESEQHGWEQAPYATKAEVDANFKRMVRHAMRAENTAAVRVGVASHNLFDVAHTLLLRELNGVAEHVELEMLEGMANHQAEAARQAAGGLLLYAPVVSSKDFPSAIAYLVRRLDENTSDENFLRDLFGLAPGSAAWNRQRERFLKSCAEQDRVHAASRRNQDRSTPAGRRTTCRGDAHFDNEADTDWTGAANRKCFVDEVSRLRSAPAAQVPLVINGGTVATSFPGIGRDPSRPGATAYTHALADAAQVEQALAAAAAALPRWSSRSVEERQRLLIRAAEVIAEKRVETAAVMLLDGGKTLPEADAEISEAVDFAHYYARAFDKAAEELADVASTPVGPVVVTPPWNFPYAIPCGGVLAALMAGNPVIMKPAPEAVLTAWHLVNHLWEAGIPRDVLQFVPAPDNDIGKALVTDSRVGAVILTGAYETARMFLGWKPLLRLHAETSGKNSLIVTAAADPDLAIKDLVKSAFGHAGQKCSAASLAILEADVYDDPAFRKQLRDAARSLTVGSVWDAASIVPPVIREPSPDLLRALTTLDEGEEWLLQPKVDPKNPGLWTPGIKLGVKPGSWFHRTECFGPVLGLVRAENLAEACRIQNDNLFGLTGGIHSLDDREIAYWRDRAEVGNAYINRPITGAIVQRQPFGGWKRSVFGPGSKAGGPNYVFTFAKWRQIAAPGAQGQPGPGAAAILARAKPHLNALSLDLATAAALSYRHAVAKQFRVEHDPSGLASESNVFRYRPHGKVILRLTPAGHDTAQSILHSLLLAVLAAEAAGVPLEVSADPAQSPSDPFGLSFVNETSQALAGRLAGQPKFAVLRVPGNTDPALASAATAAGVPLLDAPLLANGRLELLNWHREQAVSETRHRYGNLVPPPSAFRK